MQQRFTEQARQVTDLALEEARARQHGSIGTEHLLIGLLREGDGVAGQVLISLGATLDDARDQVEKETASRPRAARSRKVPYTAAAKTVLEQSLRWALRLGDSHVDTEHLLLALIHERESLGARVLTELSADQTSISQQVTLHRRARTASAAGRGR
jgi:ATP-dependent Clp protease ATP-binding subunit ClpC